MSEARKPRDPVTGHIKALAKGFKYLIEPNRMTLDYPAETMKLPQNYRGFFTVDDKKCIGCSMCEMVCPPEAITMVPRIIGEGGKTLPAPPGEEKAKGPKRTKRPVVNWGKCIFCYFCVDVCPVDAFIPTQVHDVAFENDRDYRPTYEEYLKPPEEPYKNSKKVVSKADLKRGVSYEPAP